MSDDRSARASMAASFTAPDSPMTYEEYVASPAHRELSTPDVAVGEPARDFALPVFDYSDGTRRETGETARLLDLAATQPVALIFGSYT